MTELVNAFLVASAVLAAEDAPRPDAEAPRALRVASVDAKTKRIVVKESGFEVVFDKATKFIHHRSIAFKDLPEGSAVHIHGRRHMARGPGGGGGGAADPLFSEIDCMGLGDAFLRPEIPLKAVDLEWKEGNVITKPLPFFRTKAKKRGYRLSGAEKLVAYSAEAVAPEKLAGAKVLIVGPSRKVTVERDKREVQLTRVQAKEVHWLELSPEHQKLFKTAYIEGKLDPSMGADGKAKDGEDDWPPGPPGKKEDPPAPGKDGKKGSP